jgi:hypothetical protein
MPIRLEIFGLIPRHSAGLRAVLARLGPVEDQVCSNEAVRSMGLAVVASHHHTTYAHPLDDATQNYGTSGSNLAERMIPSKIGLCDSRCSGVAICVATANLLASDLNSIIENR